MWTPSAVMGQDWFQHQGTNAIELRTFMAKGPAASTASCALCCKKSSILLCGPTVPLPDHLGVMVSLPESQSLSNRKTWCSNRVEIHPGHPGARPVHPRVEVQGVKLLLLRWKDVFDNRPLFSGEQSVLSVREEGAFLNFAECLSMQTISAERGLFDSPRAAVSPRNATSPRAMRRCM